MIVAYSYTRLSTEKQLKGYGATRQQEAIQAVCDARGWTLSDKNYSDLGVSAWKGSNRHTGALSEFIQLAKSGGVEPHSVLIVENIDRLSRQEVNESIRLMLELIDLGVSIFTLTDQRLYTKDSDNQMVDLMVWAMTAQRAHDESEMKSKRIRDAKSRNKDKMRQGVIVSRKCPEWLTVSNDKTHFIINEDVAQIVRDVFTWYAEGMSLKPIAVRLNELGVPYWGKSKSWTHTTVRNLLNKKSVIGIMQPLKRENGRDVPDGGEVQDYYPAIISKELYAQCHTLKSSKAISQGRHSNGAMVNLFKGLLKCSCGSGLALNSSTVKGVTYRSLRCSQLRSSDCVAKNWHYKATETITMLALRQLDWETSSSTHVQTSKQHLEEALSLAMVELEQVSRETENALEALLLLPTSKALAERLNAAEQRKAGLEESVCQLESQIHAEDIKLSAMRDHIDEIQQVLEDVGNDEDSRYRVNALLNRRLESITLGQADYYETQKLIEFQDAEFQGFIDIKLTTGETKRVEVVSGYEQSFEWVEGAFTEFAIEHDKYKQKRLADKENEADKVLEEFYS